MDEPVKNNKGGKRRGTPALEIDNTTHGGDKPDPAANQARHGDAPADETSSAADKVAPEAKAKARKARLVRASFALSRDDHATLAELKAACREGGAAVKKSQLLRVAVGLLREVDRGALAQMVEALPPTKKARKGNR